MLTITSSDEYFFNYNFQWLNLAWQFESCMVPWQFVHTVLEHGNFLKAYFTRYGSNAFKMWWDL